VAGDTIDRLIAAGTLLIVALAWRFPRSAGAPWELTQVGRSTWEVRNTTGATARNVQLVIDGRRIASNQGPIGDLVDGAAHRFVSPRVWGDRGQLTITWTTRLVPWRHRWTCPINDDPEIGRRSTARRTQ
jgi:hypothetical protein